jgi:Xaa-Pro aminopeptidase
MKSDLDRLMEANHIDALLIPASENEDPYRAYLSNGAHFSGMVIKKCGSPPVLIANLMEIDEAAKSGLQVYNLEDFEYSKLAKDYKDNLKAFQVAYFRRLFEALGVRGRLAFYGVSDINATYAMILNLSTGLSDLIEIVPVGDLYQIVPARVRNSLFEVAYETKDPDEIARLREAARGASAVMRAAREWIASHRAGDGVVIRADGSPLTIGEVKRYVRSRLFEVNLSDPEGMIFAQGRDAGVPHSKGEDSDPLRLGETIVFDLFPRAPGGYFHDMTRTWCIGYAAPEVQAAHDLVMEAFDRAVEASKVSVATSVVQRLVCTFFEERGHKTVLTSPGTAEGYVHTLAHGLGLNVHEPPYFPTFSESYHLQPGNVFTVEPGLYYPDRGYGVRIEDTVYLNEKGELEILTDCPYDLVIELKG